MSFDEFKKYLNKNNPQKSLKNIDLKRVVSGALAAGLLVGTLTACSKPKDKDKDEDFVPNYSQSETFTPDTGDIEEYPKYEVKHWRDGKDYLCLTEKYALDVAQQALDNVYKKLMTVDGITPVGTKDGDFYPKYFNKELITALMFNESTYRVRATDGSSLVSKDDAVGICQIREGSIDTLNQWLKNTMGINDLTYSMSDLNDETKAAEACVYLLIRFCKNEAKQGKDIYAKMGIEYSPEMQEKILLALYKNGEGNCKDRVNNGTMLSTYLNPEWRDSDGRNYVYDILNTKNALTEKYDERTR